MTMCVVRPSYSLTVPARMPSFFGRIIHHRFEVDDIDAASKTLKFGKGGFQGPWNAARRLRRRSPAKGRRTHASLFDLLACPQSKSRH